MEIIGKLIAKGYHRKVYEYLLDDEWVVKINRKKVTRPKRNVIFKMSEDEDANSAEYFYYNLLKQHNFDHYLFECKYDKYGNFIMRKKFNDIKPGKYKVPKFFGDLKRKNWGVKENNQIGCIDYSWFYTTERKGTGVAKDGVLYFKKDPTIINQKGFSFLCC